MKHFLYLGFLVSFTIQAQSVFQSEAKIEYEVIKNSVGLQKYTGELYFNNDQSFFTYRMRSGNTNDNEEVTDTDEEYSVTVNFIKTDTLERKVYVDRLKKTHVTSQIDYNTNTPVYITEKMPSLNWQLKNDSKKIGSFLCKKAILKVNSSEYVAWYTTDIPVPYGPIDLGQLPGLILEVSKTDGSLFVSAKKVSYPYSNSISLPEQNVEYITRAEYELLNVQYLNRLEQEADEKITRIVTKSGRDVKVSNLKIEKKQTKTKDH